MSSAFAIDILNLKPNTAPINSRRPILMAVSGATFDLEATIRTAMTLLLYSFLAYTTAPYAAVEASANECKLVEISSPKLGCRHRGTRTHCGDLSSWNHCLAFFACSFFIGSSQSTPVVHISWRMILAQTMYGARKPKGSECCDTVEKIALCKLEFVPWLVCLVGKDVFLRYPKYPKRPY